MRGLLKTAIIFVTILNVSACSSSLKRYEAQFLELFDTVTQVVAYVDSKQKFERQVEMIQEDLAVYHQLYDIYNDYPGINNLKAINDNAGKQALKVDQKIIDLLLFGKEVYKLTDGKVNIAFGAVLSIWHNYRTEGTMHPRAAGLPPYELLEAASLHTDIDKIIIDEVLSTVYLADPEMSLDVGAIAKGYATEQVSQNAKERGFVSGLVSVGGNVRVIGAKGENGELWNVGIQNPDMKNGEANLHIAYLAEKSLVTSGNYIRYYTVDGKEYHHIIDPDTLYPSEYFIAVTIICLDSGMADALSTAVFNMPYEQGSALIESLPNTEAFWLFPSGEQKFSTGFMEYIRK